MGLPLDIADVRIRPIRPEDGSRLQAYHAGLSAESRYRRFLGAKPTLSAADARYLAEIDGEDHVAYVATVMGAGGEDAIVAVGRFIRLPDDPRAAEFAIVVGDAWQRQGLATELLRRLAIAASRRGIERFRATMLSDNLAIQRMLERLAVGEVRRSRRGNVTEMEIVLPASPLRQVGDPPTEELVAAA
ncbi:MAG TPA: GNAT family N-acetyltransferase [Solirubrobacteraceae bacterium]|nr:GNAT family N-acetyltransferase [Solirubrobacteraceae bacterium]